MAKYITILAIVIVGILLFKNQDVFLTRDNTQNMAAVSAADTAAAPAADESDGFVLADIPKPKASVSASKINGGSVNPVNASNSNAPVNSNIIMTVNHYYDGKFWYSQNYTYPYYPGGSTVNFTASGNDYADFVKYGAACEGTKGTKCVFKTYTSNTIDVYWKARYITVKTRIDSKFNTIDGKNMPDVFVNGKILPKKENWTSTSRFKEGEAKFKAGTKLVFKLNMDRDEKKIWFSKWSGACSNVTDVCIIKAKDAIKDISVTANFFNNKK